VGNESNSLKDGHRSISKISKYWTKRIFYFFPKYREEVRKYYKKTLCRYSRNDKVAFVVGPRAWLLISASPCTVLAPQIVACLQVGFLLAWSRLGLKLTTLRIVWLEVLLCVRPQLQPQLQRQMAHFGASKGVLSQHLPGSRPKGSGIVSPESPSKESGVRARGLETKWLSPQELFHLVLLRVSTAASERWTRDAVLTRVHLWVYLVDLSSIFIFSLILLNTLFFTLHLSLPICFSAPALPQFWLIFSLILSIRISLFLVIFTPSPQEGKPFL
jgi:hypothetical protein